MRKVGILPPLTYQMQNDGEIEPAHQAYQDYDPRPREFAGQRPRNSRGQRCDLCVLTHRISFGLITRICELIFRRKLRPSFRDTKQSFNMTGRLSSGDAGWTPRPFYSKPFGVPMSGP